MPLTPYKPEAERTEDDNESTASTERNDSPISTEHNDCSESTERNGSSASTEHDDSSASTEHDDISASQPEQLNECVQKSTYISSSASSHYYITRHLTAGSSSQAHAVDISSGTTFPTGLRPTSFLGHNHSGQNFLKAAGIDANRPRELLSPFQNGRAEVDPPANQKAARKTHKVMYSAKHSQIEAVDEEHNDRKVTASSYRQKSNYREGDIFPAGEYDLKQKQKKR